jgi:membrane protein DedA with SNARE-associated domain
LSSFIIDAVRALGPFGVALLMLAENVFPPVPSEVIMPLAGYLASRGEMSFVLAVLGGTAGSLAGATFWFIVGARIDRDRLRTWIRNHGAFLAMTEEDLDRADAWFARRGAGSVFVGRLVPVVRTLISVPAGVARMPAAKFALYTFLGTGIWTLALAAGGWLLGRQFRQIEHYLGIITWIVLALVAALYIVRVVRLKRSGAASFFGGESAD